MLLCSTDPGVNSSNRTPYKEYDKSFFISADVSNDWKPTPYTDEISPPTATGFPVNIPIRDSDRSTSAASIMSPATIGVVRSSHQSGDANCSLPTSLPRKSSPVNVSAPNAPAGDSFDRINLLRTSKKSIS